MAFMKGMEYRMPAMIAHHLFAGRVFRKLDQLDFEVITNKDIAMLGAQGPDMFLYHRIFPWQSGESYADISSDFHRSSPAKTFAEFFRIVGREPRLKEEMTNYIYGFICHYALDRLAHPFINAMALKLREAQPEYGTKINQYHFRIESALDSILLRRETGRFVGDFKISSLLSPDSEKHNYAIGKLYRASIYNLFNKHTFIDSIAKGPKDMKTAFSVLSDRSGVKKSFVRAGEKLAKKGALSSSLIRPFNTDDWDYANEDQTEWANPCNTIYTSQDSFFDIYKFAVSEAVDMILYFNEKLMSGEKSASFVEMTQDRGFISDLSEIYDEREIFS